MLKILDKRTFGNYFEPHTSILGLGAAASSTTNRKLVSTSFRLRAHACEHPLDVRHTIARQNMSNLFSGNSLLLVIWISMSLSGSALQIDKGSRSPSLEAYSLRITYEKGDSRTFKTKVETTIPDPKFGALHLESLTTETEAVQDTGEDGSYTLKTTSRSLELVINGQSQPLSDAVDTSIWTYDRTGRLLDSRESNTDQSEVSDRLKQLNLANVFMVAPPLKPGETWKFEQPVGFGPGDSMLFRGILKLVGVEDSKETPTSRILRVTLNMEAAGTAGSAHSRMKVSGTSLITAERGIPLLSDVTITFSESGKHFSLHIVRTFVPGTGNSNKFDKPVI